MRAWWLLVVIGCASAPPRVSLDETWPDKADNKYDKVTWRWTRNAKLHGEYQEVLNLYAVFESPEWRAHHAAKVAADRKLEGQPRDDLIAQARAEMAGPYEVELIVTTWDRKENDLDRGKRSVWRVVLVDEHGKEIAPLEIVKDKRSAGTLKAEFPAFGDFATAYVAKFPRTEPLLGPNVRALRLRMSGERGGVELTWEGP
jgi:hypothetical protein